jgi:NCK-associated protein 1
MVCCCARRYFRHRGKTTVKSRQKHYNSDDYGDPFVAILVGLHDELLRLVYSNGKIVQNYYIEYMKGAHLTVLSEALTGLQAHTAAFSTGVQTILANITVSIDGLSTTSAPPSLEGFRLDWYRATAALTAYSSNALKIPEVLSLIARMNRVVEHSRYVDSLRSTVETRCELHELWWHRDEFQKEYVPASEASARAKRVRKR